MEKMKTTTINFDAITDGTSLLEAFNCILNSKYLISIRLNGEICSLKDVMEDYENPEMGFKKSILPKHIEGLEVLALRNGNRRAVVLSYGMPFNFTYEIKHWQSMGYNTEVVRSQPEKDRTASPLSILKVGDASGNPIAVYCLNRIFIRPERLDDFIGIDVK